MSYSNESFWEAYKSYADECRPRHRRAFETLVPTLPHNNTRILDLGSGKCEIIRSIVPHVEYLGVDLHKHTDRTYVGDITSYQDMVALCESYQPTLVTSMFAMDVVQPYLDSTLILQRLLQVESVKCVFSAGFYYDDDRRDLEKVAEVEGLESYQALRGGILENETRLELHGPSALFGQEVVEVYRLFQ